MTVKFWQMLFELCLVIGVVSLLGLALGVVMVKTMEWLERK